MGMVMTTAHTGRGQVTDTDAGLRHPMALPQSRAARHAPHALECGGVVTGPRRVHEGARAEESDPSCRMVQLAPVAVPSASLVPVPPFR